ncbi:hypothetical protein WA026_016934 [Henosepilachna vigintioctopunctata]|uniref:RING-type E3 ubiquitin transferase n=1 Tax=Henosepilachna vigintioctopunctata TaxID=420089 RepID=A0AAW1U8D5_9CUCU
MNISFNAADVALRCCICNKPLSVPPILHNSELGNICGRCEESALNYEEANNSTLERQRVYENIAKYLTFPCSYGVLGCKTELAWNSVHDHEEVCEFKNIVCPLSDEKFHDQCNWLDEHSKLAAHIKNDHKKFFSYPPETILKKDLKNKIIFSEIAGRIFVIILDYKTELNKFFCCISADLNWKDCQNYEYQVEMCSLSDDNLVTDNPIAWKKDVVQPLLGNTFATLENSLEIDMDSFKLLFDKSEKILVKINISKKSKSSGSKNNTVAANVSLNRTEYCEINEELLHDLECPVCVEFMVPPIYICRIGHNVCKCCNDKLQYCPLCRSQLLGGRNFTLEKLTATINYPCVNRKEGCGFIGPIVQVKKHENDCKLSERKCIESNCSWVGPGFEVNEHIMNSHNSLALNTVCNLQQNKDINHFYISFDNKIFILNIKFDLKTPFEYNVQYIGGMDEKYKHELHIIGSSIMDIKITLCHLCHSVNYAPVNCNASNLISMPFKFLSQFLTQFHQLSFKLNIKRLNA